MYVYITFIDPMWVETVADTWTKSMQDADTPQDQIDTMITGFRSAWEPTAIFTIEVIKYGVTQFILGMIVALFFVFRK